MMAKNNTGVAPSGELRLKQRRRTFIRFALLGMAAALGAGFALGWTLGADMMQPWLAILGMIALAALFAWFTVEYFRRIDELDLLDNLWASTVGAYFYALALPAWYLAHEAGAAPPIDHWLIYGATFTAVLIAYIARKLGVRIMGRN